MRRFALLAIALVSAVGVFAGMALARGGGWQPIVNGPWDASCGVTAVHGYPVANKELARTTATLPDGTVVSQISGSLKWRVGTDAGASIVVNSSGPGQILWYPSGSFEIVGKGETLFAFTVDQAATFGVSQIVQSKGPADVVFHTDGKVSGHLGSVVRSVCAELGVS
jgi:hypothetical protein